MCKMRMLSIQDPSRVCYQRKSYKGNGLKCRLRSPNLVDFTRTLEERRHDES